MAEQPTDCDCPVRDIDCIDRKRKWDVTQLWDSLEEFLTEDQLKLINLTKPEDNYPVLKFILEKLYDNVHLHHTFNDIWKLVNPNQNITKVLKLTENIPIPFRHYFN